LRGLPNLPRYDQLSLPVTERLTDQEQVTIPHPILLTGSESMGLIADSVTKILDHQDELRAWWREQEAGSRA
jgi:hypothetical protein